MELKVPAAEILSAMGFFAKCGYRLMSAGGWRSIYSQGNDPPPGKG
jgi:hypothetical protein